MRFRVLKTINNNIVSCLDENNREHIVMGRGLGFGMRTGQEIPEEQAEKIFRITNRSDLERVKELFASLPHEQLEVCTELIQYACDTLKRKLNDSIYYTLSDHICFAIQRVQKGLCYTNALSTEVRLFYPQEYAIGCHALAEIERRLGVHLPEDEAASIALHLVNAEYETSLGITLEVTHALAEIIEILEKHPRFREVQDSIYYDELMIHLKLLALSLFSHRRDIRKESGFVQTIAVAFPDASAFAATLGLCLEKASGEKITPEQQAYLTVNLHRVMARWE